MALSPTNARYTASAARIATSSNYISTLDLHKPDRSEDFIKRYGSQNLTGLLEMAGAKAPATQSTFSHYEEEYIHNTIKVNAIPTEAAGAFDIKITAEVDVNGATADNLRAVVRLNDILMFPDGTLGLVVGHRTHSDGENATGTSVAGYAVPGAPGATSVEMISVTSYDGTEPSAIAANDILAIVGNEHAEGTDQPSSITPQASLYSNNVMIMKESFEVTGSEATNVVYVKVQNADGSEGYLWYLKGENDTYRRFQNYCEMMMLLGEKASDATLAGADFKGTQGLLPEIKANGTTLATSAAFVAADLDLMVKGLDRERGAKENAFYCGIDLSLEVDDAIAGFNAGQVATGGAGNSMFYGNFDMGSAPNMQFTNFSRGGYTFSKSIYDPFSYTGMLGGANATQDAGADYSKIGFTVPMDSRRDAAGDAVPSMRIRYKAAGDYSREMEHWFTGGAVLQDKTNSVDNLKCHYRTERGLEVFGANRFMLVTR